jgi:hypothetical protein
MALALIGVPAAAEEQLVDGIAAQVGTRIVLVSEVMRMAGPQEAAMRSAGVPETEIARMRAAALEELIEARLIEELVRQAELYVSDDEIDRMLTDEAASEEAAEAPLVEAVPEEAGNFSWDFLVFCVCFLPQIQVCSPKISLFE